MRNITKSHIIDIHKYKDSPNIGLVTFAELTKAYRGTVSLLFEARRNRRIAVKIVDDRGIESLKIVGVK